MSGVPQARRPPGWRAALKLSKHFFKLKTKKKKKKLETQKKKKKIKEKINTSFTTLKSGHCFIMPGVHIMISMTVPSPHKLKGRIKNNSGVQGHSFKA